MAGAVEGRVGSVRWAWIGDLRRDLRLVGRVGVFGACDAYVLPVFNDRRVFSRVARRVDA